MIDEHDVDPRFSLANERTFLAWIRTAVALIVAGVAAAKALDFHHEVYRWLVAGPPIVLGAVMPVLSHRRWRSYEIAMRQSRPLRVGRDLGTLAVVIAVYAAFVLLVALLDG